MLRHATVLLLLVLLNTTAVAAVPGLPAVLHLTIVDGQERPVEGVKVTVLRPEAPAGAGGGSEISGKSGKQGQVTLTVPMPEIQGYMVRMGIEKAGYPAYTWSEFICDNFNADLTCQIVNTRKTMVHVRSSDGQAVEGAMLQFRPLPAASLGRSDRRILTKENYSSGNPAMNTAPATDSHGDFVWEHSPVPLGFQVIVGPTDKPVATIEAKDVDDVTVTLAKGSFENVIPTRVLLGKLLLPDGKPAKDWFVGGQVTLKSAGGFSGGIMQMTDTYAADHLGHPGNDGTFVIRAPGPFLGLISPEGMQFLYPLNPDSWDPPMHRLTFTVPAITGRIQLHLVDGDGKPLPGVPFRPTWMRSGSFWWQLSDDWRWGGGMAGNPDWKMVSDEQGMIDYPIYHGAEPINFQIGVAYDQPGDRSQYLGIGQLGVKTEIIVRAPTGGLARSAPAAQAASVRNAPAPEKAPWHHLTLAFVDREGKVVTNFREIHLKAAGDPSDHGPSSYADSAGLHYFLSPERRELELEIPVGVYKPLQQNITLDDSARQTVIVHVERGLPVRGQFLDDSGKLVPGVILSIYTTGVPQNRGTNGRNVLDIRATTDAEGRFEIPSAPDECFAALGFQRVRMEALKITPETRTFEVRVPPHGSVRVLLPGGFELPPSLNFIHLIASDPGRSGTGELQLDRVMQTFSGEGLAPGRYHLPADAIPGLGDISGIQVDVKADVEAILDLRRQPMEHWASGRYQTVALSVERDKQPLSGAEVAVFSAAAPPELLQRYINTYLHGTIAADKVDAFNKLHDAAGAALELLPAPGPPGSPLTQEGELRIQLAKGGDGMELLAGDLSDDAGMMHFQARAGRICWAVARVRGQALGIKRFTIPDGDAAIPPVTIALEALRPVVVPPPGGNSNSSISYVFTILKPDGMEGGMLARALSDDHLWGGRSNLAFAIHPGGYTFDGIPPGTVISLQPPQRPGTNFQPTPIPITIESGAGPMQLKID